MTLVSMRERTNFGTLAAALGRGQSSTTISGDQRLSENSGTGAVSAQVRLMVSHCDNNAFLFS